MQLYKKLLMNMKFIKLSRPTLYALSTRGEF